MEAPNGICAASRILGLTTMMYDMVMKVVTPPMISFRNEVRCFSNSKYFRSLFVISKNSLARFSENISPQRR